LSVKSICIHFEKAAKDALMSLPRAKLCDRCGGYVKDESRRWGKLDFDDPELHCDSCSRRWQNGEFGCDEEEGKPLEVKLRIQQRLEAEKYV
jgi:hypothetical protein